MPGISEGQRFLYDIWGNPFTAARREVVTTNELHEVENVPISAPQFYGFRLAEIPKRATVTVTLLGGANYTEVYSEPAATQFWVDYEPDTTDPDRNGTAYIKFHSGEDGNRFEVDYTAMGSPISADIQNELALARPLFPYFAGDGSDGDHVTSGSVAWTAVPKQYRNLTISLGDTISGGVGVSRLLIAVTERLTIQGALFMSEKGSTETGDGMGAYGGGGGGGSAGANGNGGGQKYNAAYTNTAVANPGLASLTGVGGHGGQSGGVNAGQAGRNTITSHWTEPWKLPWVRTLLGQCGGRGASGALPGIGGGNIYIECNELDYRATATLWADGGDGAINGGGPGSGGTIIVLYKKLINNLGTNHNVGGTPGAPGGGVGIGGTASVGYTAIKSVREAA